MNGTALLFALVLSMFCAPAVAQDGRPKPESTTVTTVRPGSMVPPRVAAPCQPAACPFAGQTVTMIITRSAINTSVLEVKEEFEAATGASLEIVRVPPDGDLFAMWISDLTNRSGRYDVSLAGAWWLGELVSGDYIIPYDKYYGDPRFPKWDMDDVLPGPRRLLSYDGKHYMVANDHDGQVLYYRRDLLADPQHQTAFQQKYGYPLAVPDTWDQFRDVAEYFTGKDLNGDGVPDYGLTLALKRGSQAMFNYMTVSAPFVIGKDNQKLYWFDPETMKPLIESPGHLRALQAMVDLVRFGPKEMHSWNHGAGWDLFLAGRAALAVTWGDLGALAQQEGSRVKGKTGTAQPPGTHEYYSITQGEWVRPAGINRIGNTNGASWAGVISKYSKAPEASYYLLSLLATREKSAVYAARGWDGVDPGRYSHFLPPDGTGRIETYLEAGWNEVDIRDYLKAFYDTFNNELQFPYLRIPGAFSYWLALDLHVTEALSGQLTPEAALKATAVDFEEITQRLGRDQQRRAYRESLGF